MASEWYYAQKKAQRGPVTQEQLRVLADAGEIAPGTLVWTAGMSSWQPLSDTAAADALSLPTPGFEEEGTHRCQGCGKVLPEDDLIQLRRLWVCGSCKPRIVQQLREGVPPLPRYSRYSGGRPHPSNPVPHTKTNGQAIAGLALGCTSLFFVCPPVCIIMALIGLIFSMIAHRHCRQDPDLSGKGIALAGIITSAISLLVYISVCMYFVVEII
jgi:hypothetical protein